MPFNGTMLSNENVLASLDTLTDWRVGAIAVIEGTRLFAAFGGPLNYPRYTYRACYLSTTPRLEDLFERGKANILPPLHALGC